MGEVHQATIKKPRAGGRSLPLLEESARLREPAGPHQRASGAQAWRKHLIVLPERYDGTHLPAGSLNARGTGERSLDSPTAAEEAHPGPAKIKGLGSEHRLNGDNVGCILQQPERETPRDRAHADVVLAVLNGRNAVSHRGVRQALAFTRQARCCVLGQHQPGIQPGPLDEEAGKVACEVTGAQPIRPTLRLCQRLCHRGTQVVQR